MGPESGPDCLICAEFARQQVRAAHTSHHAERGGGFDLGRCWAITAGSGGEVALEYPEGILRVVPVVVQVGAILEGEVVHPFDLAHRAVRRVLQHFGPGSGVGKIDERFGPLLPFHPNLVGAEEHPSGAGFRARRDHHVLVLEPGAVVGSLPRLRCEVRRHVSAGDTPEDEPDARDLQEQRRLDLGDGADGDGEQEDNNTRPFEERRQPRC